MRLLMLSQSKIDIKEIFPNMTRYCDREPWRAERANYQSVHHIPHMQSLELRGREFMPAQSNQSYFDLWYGINCHEVYFTHQESSYRPANNGLGNGKLDCAAIVVYEDTVPCVKASHRFHMSFLLFFCTSKASYSVLPKVASAAELEFPRQRLIMHKKNSGYCRSLGLKRGLLGTSTGSINVATDL